MRVCDVDLVRSTSNRPASQSIFGFASSHNPTVAGRGFCQPAQTCCTRTRTRLFLIDCFAQVLIHQLDANTPSHSLPATQSLVTVERERD